MRRPSLRLALAASYLAVIASTAVLSGLLARSLAQRHVAAALGAMDPRMAREHVLLVADSALVWGAVLGVVVALLLGWWLAGTLSAPLHRLAARARNVGHGDYAERVAPEGSRELAEVAEAFNEMAAGLERLERLRRELVQNVAHELRTPLTNIQGYLEAAVDGAVPRPEALHRAHRETLHLLRLVEDLTQLARLEAGYPPLVLQPVPLQPALEQALDRFRERFEARGVRLDLRLPPRLPPALIDPDRIVQVLSNLLDNALHHTPAGGVVEVGARVEGQAITLWVADTGPGMAAEDAARVFERFYRADRSRARATGGAGIGLTLAREIVRLHGGSIELESEPGRGTRVELRLPRASPERSPGAEATSAGSSRQRAARL